MPDGKSQCYSIFRVVVLSDEGGEWYKVELAGETFFLNLSQAIRVYEEDTVKRMN
jgi:hypothetical protein